MKGILGMPSFRGYQGGGINLLDVLTFFSQLNRQKEMKEQEEQQKQQMGYVSDILSQALATQIPGTSGVEGIPAQLEKEAFPGSLLFQGMNFPAQAEIPGIPATPGITREDALRTALDKVLTDPRLSLEDKIMGFNLIKQLQPVPEKGIKLGPGEVLKGETTGREIARGLEKPEPEERNVKIHRFDPKINAFVVFETTKTEARDLVASGEWEYGGEPKPTEKIDMFDPKDNRKLKVPVTQVEKFISKGYELGIPAEKKEDEGEYSEAYRDKEGNLVQKKLSGKNKGEIRVLSPAPKPGEISENTKKKIDTFKEGIDSRLKKYSPIGSGILLSVAEGFDLSEARNAYTIMKKKAQEGDPVARRDLQTVDYWIAEIGKLIGEPKAPASDPLRIRK